MSELGQYLKELRGNRSLREIEKLSGVSHTYLSSLEKGKDPRTGNERKPTPDTLMKLAKTYSPHNDEPLYRELMFKAGLMAPPPNIDFGRGEDFKLIKLWFKDIKEKCSVELMRLEEHYRPVFGKDFTISIKSLNELLWTVPFTQGAAMLYEDLLGLIKKVKNNKNKEPELRSILDIQNEVFYNGHLLTNRDRERILSMLEALFPEYAKRP